MDAVDSQAETPFPGWKLAQGLILRALRRGWTQGQAAKRLAVSPGVISNLEKGRSRVPLTFFKRLLELRGLSLGHALQSSAPSLGVMNTSSPATIVGSYRRRLQLSQADLAKLMGYRSAAVVHHFEKGLRIPSLENLFVLMSAAGDDCYRFVLEITGSPELADRFPKGGLPEMPDVEDYWSQFYISAVRQLIRSHLYRQQSHTDLKWFMKTLRLTEAEVQHALRVLARLNLIINENGKFIHNPQVKLLRPQGDLTRRTHLLKQQWLKHMSKSLDERSESNQLFTADQLPISAEMFGEIVRLVRQCQDEVHRLPLKDTNGLGSLLVLAQYTALEIDSRSESA